VSAARRAAPGADVSRRVKARDWAALSAELDARGCARIEGLLAPAECAALAGLYPQDEPFRSRVVMARHGFGSGEYKYFAYPLPALVAELRSALYAELAPLANRWREALGSDVRHPPGRDVRHPPGRDVRHPPGLDAFLARCHRGGQRRPTPLLLQYGEGDYNCLHQDLYGEHVFPIQVTLLLSRPGEDFSGGELVLVERRPRMQSRAEVVSLAQGDAVAFAVRERPVQGARGSYRVELRHGVSRLRSGRRLALGVIFHDAA
jgi:hypothetical protein